MLPYAAASQERELDNLRNPPRQSRSRSLVDRIVDATARILVNGGHGALTTNGAAAEAGISVGSLYRYFHNKDALIVAVIEREGRRCYDHIREATGPDGSGTLAEHVGRIVRATVDAYRSIAARSIHQPMELRRVGVFDCRAAALSAISDAFGNLNAVRSGSDGIVENGAPVIMAEIIVALVEAAVTRPSVVLSPITIEATAIAAAIAYWRHGQNPSNFSYSEEIRSY